MNDILYIGYPKAGSTYLRKYLREHPQVSLQHNLIAEVLSNPDYVPFPVPTKKVRVLSDETIVESVCVVGDPLVWRENRFKVGGFPLTTNDVVINPCMAADRLYKWFPSANVLIVLRDPVTWFESIFRWVRPMMPPGSSFADYWTTPDGMGSRMAAHHTQIIEAYKYRFREVMVLYYERINTLAFRQNFCDFIGIEHLPFPARRENVSSATATKLRSALPFLSLLPASLKEALWDVARYLPKTPDLLEPKDVELIRATYGPYPYMG